MTNREYLEYHVKARQKAQKKDSKYHAEKALRIIDGQKVWFDSKHEAERWDELRVWEIVGKIQQLQRQVKFSLIPNQKDENGKIIERGVSYVADFAYLDSNGDYIVEDAKGMRTKEYILKRKLMLYIHKIRIREV